MHLPEIKSLFYRLKGWLSLIGPGLFLIGYNIGTGSITTMARAGADFGMSLFWALLLSCIFTYVLMLAYGRLTLTTGCTALTNMRTHLPGGKLWALYILTTLITGELLALVGIMGIVADLINEGIMIVSGRHTGTLYITGILILLMYGLLWWGEYRLFERVLTGIVMLMGMCFVAVFFMVKPNLVLIVKGLVPAIPSGSGSLMLIAAVAGTTCSAAVFIMRSAVLSAKGWDVTHLRHEKRDAFVSAFMMLLLSGCIMAVAAGTLRPAGLSIERTQDLIELFRPLGGKVAALILIVGVSSAALSTLLPIVLIAPWLISDYRGVRGRIKSPLFRIQGGIGLLFGFASQITDMYPPLLMILSQAFQACILPAITIPVMLLINRQSLMGEYKSSGWLNAGLWLVLLFGLFTTVLAITEFTS